MWSKYDKKYGGGVLSQTKALKNVDISIKKNVNNVSYKVDWFLRKKQHFKNQSSFDTFTCTVHLYV